MSLSYFFRDPTGAITDITSRVRLYSLDVTSNAEEATVATSQITVDDPAGDLIIGGHRLFYVTEDSVSSSSNSLVWIGYTADRTMDRGPFETEAGRRWQVNLVDENTLLERRILTTSAASRPAETDVSRIQWVAAISALIDDTQYLSTANPVAMDAVDYKGQTIASVINDCMQQSGKNAFVWRRQEATNPADPMGSVSLWYGAASLTTYISDARMSNVRADVDMVNTFAISRDTQLRRDPSRVYSGVYMQYDGGVVYEQRTVTATNFAIGGRDTASPASNVKTNAKATARAQRYLVNIGTEEDVITTTLEKVPAASVNRFMAGMMTQIKATHLPGYESWRDGRILNRNVKQTSEEFFSIRMELSLDPGSYAGGAAGGSGSGGSGGSSLSCIVPACSGGGGPVIATVTSGTNAQSTEGIQLYDGATYHFEFTIHHATTNFECNIAFYMSGTGHGAETFPLGAVDAGHAIPSGMDPDGPLYAYSLDHTTGSFGNQCYYVTLYEGGGYAGCNIIGSSVTVVATYVSGPDPRWPTGSCP